MKLFVLGPTVLVILGKVTHLLSGLVNFPLKIGETKHLFLFPLDLLMNGFEVPDFLVQLLLLKCWTAGLPLLASGLSKRECLGLCPVAAMQPLALLSS